MTACAAWTRIVWLMSIAGAMALAQEHSSLLVRARQLEHVSHQPEQAIEAYQSVAEDSEWGSEARSEAAIGLVRCLLKLGKSDLAAEWIAKLPAAIGLPSLATQLGPLLAAYQSPAPAAQDAPSFSERVKTLVDALDSANWQNARDTLRDLGEPVAPYLLGAVRTSSKHLVMIRALELLAQHACANPNGKAADFFAALDQEPDPILVAKSLNALNGPTPLPDRLWPTMRKLSSSNLSIIKKPLLSIMARRGDEESSQFVQRMMDDTDPSVRSLALTAGLNNLPQPQAIALARKIFAGADRDRQNSVIRWAAENSILAGWLAAFECSSARLRFSALQYARHNTSPGIDLGFLTSAEKLGLIDPVMRTLRDPEIKVVEVADLLSNSPLLELPFMAHDLASIASARGGSVASTVAAWLVAHLDEPGAVEAVTQLGEDASLAGDIVGSLRGQHTALNHRVVLALGNRHGWCKEWAKPALDCLWKEADDTTAEACRRILAQPEDELRKFFAATGRNARDRVLFGGLSSLSTESDDLVERLSKGEPIQTALLVDHTRGGRAVDTMVPSIVSIPDLVTNLPTGPQLLQHEQIMAFLCRVYDQPNDSVTRLRAMHLLKSTGSKPIVLERLLAPIAFPSIQDINVWQAYRDEQPELKGQSTTWDTIRSKELDAIVRVAFAGDDSVVVDFERFLAQANDSTREQLVGIVINRVTDIVRRERPALRDALQARLLAILDDKSFGDDLSESASWSLRSLLEPATMSDQLLARLLRSPHSSVVDGALDAVLAGRKEAHRARVEELLASSPDVSLRVKAVEVLSAFADMRSGKVLTEALRDPSDGVRGEAKKALENLRLYLDEKARWEQFEARGESALSPLTALVKQARDPAKKVRLAAIRALGAFGDQAALPHLIELLKDPDSDIQAIAEKAIDTLATTHR